MTLWNKDNIKDLVCLEQGDIIVFPNSDVEYVVTRNHLSNRSGESNRRAIADFLALPTSDMYCNAIPALNEFTIKCYGYACQSGMGSWPEFKQNDFAAATRMVKTLFGMDSFASEENRQRGLAEQEELLRVRKEEKARREADILAKRAQAQAEKEAKRAQAQAEKEAKRAQAQAEKEAKLSLLSSKGRAIMELLNDGRPFGCRTPYVRKLMALIIGEDLPATDGDKV